MSEKWETEINEVLRDSGVPSTQEITIAVLYHHAETAVWQRRDLFCQVFSRQFQRAYPSVRIDWQPTCLPLVENDVLPRLRSAHILLIIVSVECLLDLHQIPLLYAALASSPQDKPHRAGIVARSAPLSNEQIRFAARFPTDTSSLALCQEDDEVYTEVITKIWGWARNMVERL